MLSLDPLINHYYCTTIGGKKRKLCLSICSRTDTQEQPTTQEKYKQRLGRSSFWQLSQLAVAALIWLCNLQTKKKLKAVSWLLRLPSKSKVPLLHFVTSWIIMIYSITWPITKGNYLNRYTYSCLNVIWAELCF